MASQAEKAQQFRALHHRNSAFILPNPWDVGSARILAQLGFEALATTSAGYAFFRGTLDGRVGRDAMMAHIAELVRATDLPVSADLENGYGDAPELVAETICMAAAQGLAGGSIEDATGSAAVPIYPLELAKERIAAAAEAARSLGFAFTLTARAENFLHGRPDLKDTISRLQAFQQAGADVLYAPGLTTREQIAEVVRSVDRPVNVLAGMPDMRLNAAELSELGVKRISTGSALARAALGGLLLSAREMALHGTFGFVEAAAANSRDVTGLLEAWQTSAREN
jgi:2-methylisocitrate lyase-like PEP mutase family enzyme